MKKNQGANVPPPPKKTSRKGPPPAAAETNTHNTDKPSKSELVPMNFKVDADFHKDFKLTAVENDLTMVKLMREALAVYKKFKAGELTEQDK